MYGQPVGFAATRRCLRFKVFNTFIVARRCANATYAMDVSLCLPHGPSVRHKPGFCQNIQRTPRDRLWTLWTAHESTSSRLVLTSWLVDCYWLFLIRRSSVLLIDHGALLWITAILVSQQMTARQDIVVAEIDKRDGGLHHREYASRIKEHLATTFDEQSQAYLIWHAGMPRLKSSIKLNFLTEKLINSFILTSHVHCTDISETLHVNFRLGSRPSFRHSVMAYATVDNTEMYCIRRNVHVLSM